MRNSIIIFLVSILFTFQLIAQANQYNQEQVDETIFQQELTQQFKNYKIVTIETEDILKEINSYNGVINITLDIDKDEKWPMEIIPENTLVDDLKVYSASKGLEENINIYPLKGNILNQNSSDVRITFAENFIYGYIQDDNFNRFIEPLRNVIIDAPKNLYLVYNGDDVIFPEGEFCASSHLKSKEKEFGNYKFLVSTGLCYEVEVATASDFLMYQNHNSNVADVTAHNVGVMNNVQGNYDDEFADEILFVLVEQWISDCNTCDPWVTTNNASDLLSDFRQWAPSGFNETHDIGQLWTNRNIEANDGSQGVIGLAYVGAVCGSFRYQLLEDFSSNANLKRVMVAHETGHNFDAVSSSSTGHDPQGSAFIMAPSVSNVTAWSTASISDIESYYNGINCLAACAPPAPPISDFIANETAICPGTTIQFFDQSTGNPNSWNWTFTGGTPGSSTLENPTVTYNNAGVYNVTLNVTNSAGSNQNTKTGYIVVSNSGNEILFMDDFSAGLSLWNVTNPDNNITWESKDVAGSTGGESVAWINNYDYNNGVGDLDGLETPMLDFSGRSNVTLDMEYAYARYNANNSDILRIRVSTDGGNSFPNVVFTGQENGSGNFATAPDNIEIFEPLDASQWCIATTTGPSCISLDLSAFDGLNNVVVRIENESDYGNNLYIDNVWIKSSCQVLSPPVTVFASNVTSGCAPLIVQFQDLSSSGPSSWSWSFPGGNPSSSTDQNPIVVYNNPGFFDVSLTTSNSAGTSSDTYNNFIEVLDVPESSFTSSVNGNNAFFTNTSVNATFYNWTFGDGQSSTDENPVHIYDEDGEYTVTLVAGNICGTSTFTFDVTIATEPIPGIGYNITEGCAPLTVSFTNESSTNTDAFLWTFEGGTPSSSSDENPTVIFNEAGIFDVSLTVYNEQGENSQTLTDLVVVDDVPDVSFFSIPDGFTVNFTNTTTGGNSYFWDFGDTNSSNEENPSHTYSSDGDFTVTLTATNDCGDNIISETVTISSLPAAGFSVNNAVGCPDFTVQFQNNSSTNSDSYFWQFEGGNPASSTEETPTVVYTSPGTYDVSLTVTNEEGTDTESFQDYITVLDNPVADFSFTTNLQSVDFTNNSINGTTYFWNFGDGNTSSLENPTHGYDEDGTYVVTLTVSNICGEVDYTEIINISSPVSGGFNSNVTSGCAPLTVQFTDNSSSNVMNWQWSFPGGTPSTSTAENPSVTYNEAGNYNVILQVSNNDFSDEVVMSSLITVNDVPDAEFIFDVDELTADFTNNSDNATTYFWDFGDGNFSGGENPSHEYDAEGIYEVTLVATNACGSDTTVISVNISSLPTANFTADAQVGCATFTVDFIDLSTSSTTAWEWTFEGGTPSTSTEQNPKIQYTSGGVFDVTLVAKNDLGEDTYTLENYISVSELPQVSISNMVNGNVVQFSAISDNVDSYEWNIEGFSNPFILENPEVTFPADGTYMVTLKAKNDCGSMNFTTAVTITAYPDGAFNVLNDPTCAPAVVNFEDKTTDEPSSWIWNFEGGTPAISTEQNPIITYDNPGTYDVELIVSNEYGSDTITKQNEIILEEGPTADFMFATSENTVEFTNTSSGEGNVTWFFGNGDASTEENPDYTYPALGDYQVTLIIDNGANCTDTMTQLVQILTINEILTEIDKLKIYPNPARDNFIIDLKASESASYQFSLINSLGQVVLSKTLEIDYGNNKYSIDSDFPSGVYYIKLSKKDEAMYKKIVLQK